MCILVISSIPLSHYLCSIRFYSISFCLRDFPLFFSFFIFCLSPLRHLNASFFLFLILNLSLSSYRRRQTLKAFLPNMLERNHGHIVTIASIMGELVVPGLSDYCMSKFAAVALHESLLREARAQGKDGVHFTLINPYKIDTGMFDGATIKKS